MFHSAQHILILALASFVSTSPIASTSSSSAPCPSSTTAYTPPETIVSHWYGLWAGNYGLLDKTVTPNVQVYQDRFPTGNGGSARLPIFNSSALLGFVKSARADFESYSFIDDFHFGVPNLLALRWTLNATFAGATDANAKKGKHIAYNGTDILMLEPCSGLVQEVLSAQDLITYYYELGEKVTI